MFRKRKKKSDWPHQPSTLYNLPKTLPGSRPWPKISIVTPTYNQGCYIEETILSVANQCYPNLEHIIMDGGSTDDTAQILERHRHRFAHVMSGKDKGQSDAINKGMALATGQILTWLNSDDMLAPGALGAAALAFDQSGADMVAGICELYRDGVLEDRHLTSCVDGPLPVEDILDLDGGWNAGQFFYQPEVLFTREIWERAGGHVDVELFYSMDYDLWLRFAEAGARIHVIGRPVAMFRMHDQQKTHVAARFHAELEQHKAAYMARRPDTSIRSRGKPDHAKRLKIGFLNDHGWKWGAGIAHRRLVDACRLAGHDVLPFALGTGRDATPDDIVYELENCGIDVVFLGNVHGADLPVDRYAAVAKRWPTFIFLHDLWWLTGRCAYSGDCGKLDVGCDATCPTPDEYPALAPPLIRPAWDDKRETLADSDGPVLLAMSRWAKEVASRALRSTQKDAKVELVSLGLPTGVFRPRDKRSSRKDLKLPVDKILVLCSATDFGDLRKGSNFVLSLIKACDRPNVLFVTVGHGDQKDFKAHPRVICLPYQSNPGDVAKLYSAVDLILAPSREETFGQVFIEAAACGTPCLAFQNSGVKDAVVHGVTGHLAIDQSVESLKKNFDELLQDPQYVKDLGTWGRLHAENTWSLEASYRSLFQALRKTGIADAFGLAHKISLGQIAQEPMRVGTIISKETAWAAGPGVEDIEGPYPDQNMSKPYRWLQAPGCTIDLRVHADGTYLMVLGVQNHLFKRQRVTVSYKGTAIADCKLVQRYGDHFDHVPFEVDLCEGKHSIDLTFSRGLMAAWTEGQTLALRLESLTILRKA